MKTCLIEHGISIIIVGCGYGVVDESYPLSHLGRVDSHVGCRIFFVEAIVS